jgi:2-polyprenyl-3-methyl-5-hydroxy-6-metoxy-1,4-benzoquinol methylase
MPEKMDEPSVPADDVYLALRELEIINKYLGGYNVMTDALDKLGLKKEFTLMDLGCGGGDMLRTVCRFANSNGFKLKKAWGIDINPFIVDYAMQRSEEYPQISYIQKNIWDETLFDYKPDVVVNSLFCHHFNNLELIGLLKRMYELCGKAIIINDLHRHWIAYHSIKALSQTFSKSYLVKYDGPLSVARSLNKREWEWILGEAGITNYQINWKWAWRWQIIIRKD